VGGLYPHTREDLTRWQVGLMDSARAVGIKLAAQKARVK